MTWEIRQAIIHDLSIFCALYNTWMQMLGLLSGHTKSFTTTRFIHIFASKTRRQHIKANIFIKISKFWSTTNHNFIQKMYS